MPEALSQNADRLIAYYHDCNAAGMHMLFYVGRSAGNKEGVIAELISRGWTVHTDQDTHSYYLTEPKDKAA